MSSKKLSETAEVILKERYYNPGEDWRGLCKRVAEYIGIDEKYEYDRFFEMMHELDFLPNSPTLMNAGTELKNLSACFILPIPAHMEGIFNTLKVTALIQASGGGTGFDLSDLRPKGALVSSTGGVTSGPISFLKVYDSMSDVIKQGGKRRAANGAMMRCDHLDIKEFIQCKTVEGKITNFAISVAVLDDFMKACEEDGEWKLDFNTHDLEPLIIRANKLMDMIVDGAWKNGEPGLFFIDTVNRLSTIDEYIAAANPCEELPGPPWFSCNLGSINLSQCVNNGKIDWSKLNRLVRFGIRFLDNVVERNEYIIPEIAASAKKYRPLGLGVMGWADMLLKLQIRYGSEESLDLARKIGSTIMEEAKRESNILCRKRGENGEGKDRRNAMLTSIAPTGTISMFAGCSSGIEPNFAWTWQSNRMDRVFDHFHPLAQKYLKQGKGLPDYFVTAFDVSPSEHVCMQAAWQENIDHAISKTINLPNDATKEAIRSVFFQAWKLGCKGITVYRDGSRKEQVLVSKTKTDIVGVEKVAPVKRPKKLYGTTMKQRTKDGTVYTTVNFMSDSPVEVFLNAETHPTIDGLGRLISLSLRSNVSVKEVIEQLKQSNGVVEVAVANAIDESLAIEKEEPCPSCGVNLVRRSGCRECPSCGWSACIIS